MTKSNTAFFLRNLKDWAAELQAKYQCPVSISRDRTGYVFVIQTEYNIDIPKMYRSIPVRRQLIAG